MLLSIVADLRPPSSESCITFRAFQSAAVVGGFGVFLHLQSPVVGEARAASAALVGASPFMGVP